MTTPATGRNLVIDASAMGAILFGEADAASVASAIAGYSLIAPALITTELTSIGLKKIRRDGEDAESVAAALAEFSDFNVRTVATPSARLLPTAVNSKLSAYDASYLLLASDLAAPLLTLDKALGRASLEAGIEVLS